jgi:transposase
METQAKLAYNGEPIFKFRKKTPHSPENIYKDLPKPAFYGQRWDLYYLARQSEKEAFFYIIKNVVDEMELSSTYSGNGRPSANFKDIIKALCIKIYTGQSSWNLNSDLVFAKQLGIIQKVYKKSCLNKYLNDSRITPILERIYKTIAEPLAEIEDVVAVDSTGISDSYGKKRWVEVRTEHQEHKKYVKLHILCGTNTNIICSAIITEGNANDNPKLPELLSKMQKFKPKELCADSGYLSKLNTQTCKEHGIIPYIMPKKNTGSQIMGLSAWGTMIHMFKEHEIIFRSHYHKRSNIESTFSALKRRFFDFVRVKGKVGQINEILCKVICLNCVLLSQAVLIFPETRPDFMDS